MKDCEDIIALLDKDNENETVENIKVKRNAKISLCLSLKEASRIL